jgi:oxygen-independent coproporphyrinogen-3 oxidase
MKPPRAYIERVSDWHADGPLHVEALASAAAIDFIEEPGLATARAETMMMGLRLNDGVANADFRARFGVDIAQAFPRAVADCLDDRLLEWDGDHLRLTLEGRPLGNEAFGRFVNERQA